MSLEGSLRHLADEITTAAQPATGLGYTVGQVQDVTAGIVTVTVLGVQQQVPYLDTAPTVGATVAVLFIAGSPLILGTVNGNPTF